MFDPMDDPPEPAVAEPLTLDRVRGTWRSVVDAVGSQNGPLGAVLDAAQPMTVEGATITLGVPYAFHARGLSGAGEAPHDRRCVVESGWLPGSR